MTPSRAFSDWTVLALILISGIAVDKVLSQQEVGPAEVQSETSSGFQTSGADNENPSNRVLPVDAEHKSKISFRQKPLDPLCVKIMRDNLLKFLKRVKRSETRKGRQDDGDDDGDEDGGGGAGGIAGVLGNLAEGNGALSTLAAVPALFPSLVSTLTQTVGAVNQGLNGTDTPDLPSFLVKQAQEAVRFFQAVGGAAQASQSRPQQSNSPPMNIHVQRIPGETPMRKPRPTPANYEYPTDPDYPDEEVKQPPQPSLKPHKPLGGGGGGRPEYEPIPGSNNPFLQNTDIGLIRNPQQPPSSADSGSGGNNGPQKASLWSIYKSFSTKNGGGTGSLTEFQLAHPEAFSNELLHSISQSISGVRGPSQIKGQGQDIPSSELFKQFYPTQKPALFNTANRPSLSVYRPSAALSGVGLDLNHLALNSSVNNEQAVSNNNEEDEATIPPSFEQQNELESEDSGLRESLTGGSDSTFSSGQGTYHQQQQQLAQSQSNLFGSFGNGNAASQLSQLQQLAQLQQLFGGSKLNGNSQPTNSPPENQYQSQHSQPLTVSVHGYEPAISSLHDIEEQANKVGPQATWGDSMNGFKHKTPYTPVNNGILFTAPRLTPAPYLALKRPSGLTGNFGDRTQTTPTPDFTYQFSNSGSSLVPPGANIRPAGPNAHRAPAVVAAIPNKFQYAQNTLHTNSLPPSVLKEDDIPESEKFGTRISSLQPASINYPEINSVPVNNKFSTVQEHIVPPPEEQKVDQIKNNPFSGVSLISSPSATVQTSTATKQTSGSSSLFSLYEKIVSENPPPPNNHDKEPTAEADIAPSGISTLGSLSKLPQPSSQSSFSSNLLLNLKNPPQTQQPLFQQQAAAGNLDFSQFGKPSPPFSLPTIGSEIQENDSEGLAPTYQFIPTTTEQAVPSTTVKTQSTPGNNFLLSNSFFSPATNENPSPLFQAQNPNPINSQSLLANFYPLPQFSQRPDALVPNLKPTNIETNESPSILNTNQFGSLSSSSVASQNGQPSFLQILTGGGNLGGNTGDGAATSQNNLYVENSQFKQPEELPLNQEETLVSETPPATESTVLEHSTKQIIQALSGSSGPNDKPFFPNFVASSQFLIPSGIYPEVEEQRIIASTTTTTTTTTNSPTSTSTVKTTPPPEVNKLSHVKESNQNLPIHTGYLQFSPEHFTDKTEKPEPQNEVPPVYQNLDRPLGFPDSFVSGVPASSNISPSSNSNPSKDTKPLNVGSSGFQGPILTGGYPASVPSLELLGGPSGLVYLGESAAAAPGSPVQAPLSSPENNALIVSNESSQLILNENLSTQQNLVSAQPELDILSEFVKPTGHVGQNIQPQLPHAIAEMSKLPFYQEDSFRPSALPAYLIGNEYEEDSSQEQQQGAGMKKPSISEIFSNITKEADKLPPPSPEKVSTAPSPTPLVIPAEEEPDYVDARVPNFPPGKPAYWMNMYYPSGIPVLTKVRNPRTTIRPQRVNPRPNLPPPLPPPDDNDDDDDDDDANKKKEKKIA